MLVLTFTREENEMLERLSKLAQSHVSKLLAIPPCDLFGCSMPDWATTIYHVDFGSGLEGLIFDPNLFYYLLG